MNRDLLIVFSVIVVAFLAILGGYAVLVSEDVNCEMKYNQTMEGEIQESEIPEQCRPLPEDVEKKLLLNALGGA